MRKTLDILSHDEEFSTIFARGVSGSVTLDIIPDAIQYLKSNPKFKQMYLQDFMGTEFIISQESTIESAIQAWEVAGDIRRGTYKPKSASTQAPVQTAPASSEPMFIL
jgi:hypothetical protein